MSVYRLSVVLMSVMLILVMLNVVPMSVIYTERRLFHCYSESSYAGISLSTICQNKKYTCKLNEKSFIESIRVQTGVEVIEMTKQN